MSLQVWFPLNGDLSNNGLMELTSATASGTTIATAGKIGMNCYSFDGEDSYILCSPAPLSNSTEDWSFACWFKPNNKHNGCLFSNRTKAAATGITIIYTDSGGFLFDDGVRWTVALSKEITVGKWNHLVFTRSKTKGKKLYLNGELINSITTVKTPTTANPSHFIIGQLQSASATAAGNAINGYLNDVRIYDHCLSAKEVKEISRALVIHYPLNEPNFNYLRQVPYRNVPTAYQAMTASIITNLVVGNTYTLQLWDVDVSHSKKTADELGIWVNWGSGALNNLLVSWTGGDFIDGHADYLVKTFTVPDEASSGTWRLLFYNSYPSVSGTMHMSIGRWKLELGSAATEYATTYTEYDGDGSLHYIYDRSGFHNDGRTNATSHWKYLEAYDNLVSPRYSRAFSFNGSSQYVKCNTNAFMADHAEEMTINFWAYSLDWSKETAGGRLFSCTESGGFNVEGGSSGYWKWNVYVATNAAQTSHAYKGNYTGVKIADLTQGWHMFTFIYTTSRLYVYLDGALHSSYALTSYGIRYNTNARLFIGCEAKTASSSGPYFDGLVSDFRLYYTALSAEDILFLYQAPASADRNGNLWSYSHDENTTIGRIDKNGIWNHKLLAEEIESNDSEALPFPNTTALATIGKNATFAQQFQEI